MLNGVSVFMTGKDPKRVLTTVGFPALQFNTAKNQFVGTRMVPKAAIHRQLKLTFNFQSEMKKRPFKD
jgi:hypothetical protein